MAVIPGFSELNPTNGTTTVTGTTNLAPGQTETLDTTPLIETTSQQLVVLLDSLTNGQEGQESSVADLYVSEDHERQNNLDRRSELGLDERFENSAVGLSVNPTRNRNRSLPPLPQPTAFHPRSSFLPSISAGIKPRPTSHSINRKEGKGNSKDNPVTSTSKPEKKRTMTKLFCISEDMAVCLIEAMAELYESFASSSQESVA